MLAVQTCPRCRLKISSQRMRSHPVVCDSCGHVLSANSVVIEEKIEQSFLLSIVGFSVAMIAGFILVANWGEHSLEAVTFEAGEIVGIHSARDYEHMSEVCLSLRRYKCVEKMYFQVARKDAAQFARLGRFQLNQGKYKEALESFRRYFANGNSKKDVEINYHYAKALAELGMIDEAAKRFEFVIDSRPQVMQVTVVQNYVKYLVQANRYDQAKRVIQKMRHRDRTVSQFMDTELKMIQAKLEVRSNS
jgi:tetratricopeptide (TPR) repeat protein